MKALALAQAAGVTLWRDGDSIGYEGEMTDDLADAITAERAALLAVLSREDRVDKDPDFPDVEADRNAEAQALDSGWTRNPDGSWEFPVGWATLYPRTPEGFDIDWDGIEAVRTASRVALPADEQPRPGLRPLTPAEQAQIRAGGALPAGVSYGQTRTGQWRRLT